MNPKPKQPDDPTYSWHPHDTADIHPAMPTALHVAWSASVYGYEPEPHPIPLSPVAARCLELNLSIHDRHDVYEQMKREGRA